ncbi:MAG TPA: hypothetical protein VIF62_34870 [Labilithrix sp.]
MRKRLIFSLTAMLAAAPSVAFAQAPSADALAAEAAFRDGKALVAAGKTSEACAKFAESERLDPQLGTLLYLATCHAQEGKSATAWAEYLQAADQASRAHDATREKIARDRADKLAPSVPRLTIQIDASNPAVDLSLDGQPVHASAGVPIPVDPGKHTIAASAASRKPWSQSIDVAAGGARVAVPALEIVSEKVDEPPPPPPPPKPEEPKHPSTTKWIGWGAVALGVVGIGVGSAFGVKSLSNKSASDDACNAGACTAAGLASYDDARSAARVADVAIGVGIVAVVVGVVLILVSPSAPSASAQR